MNHQTALTLAATPIIHMDSKLKFHFISGLPRSGSTLLAALLKQNPRFSAGMSSPVGPLVTANLKMMSAGSEAAIGMSERQKQHVLRSLFDAYYADTLNCDVVFDTNRLWCARMPLLHELFPAARVIACVRDIPWIMDSIERILQKNPFDNSKLFANESERATVYSRMATLARHDKLIGFPWAALKEAYYGAFSEKLLLVEYDLLARQPEQVLRLVYEFIGEPWFEGHDVDNVHYEAPEFDEALGLSGLHTVRKKVELQDRQTILPPDIFEKYMNMAFWRTDTRSRASVLKPIAQPQ